ncbi:hypothetical protein [Sulfurimonas sp.]|uniref:hypothetical protein n=1 Tax=Sulfurimonas sp. TaxID=2022749 RepID=UPI003D133783
MWLKKTIDKHYINFLQEHYARADRRFKLKENIKVFPCHSNPIQYHLAGYVAGAYNHNGTSFIELQTKNETLTIVAPKYIDPNDLEFQSVLCVGVIEYHNDILDNSVFMRTCSKVVVL